MKITVFSGSPKGEHSVTLQYLEYIKKRFPAHEYTVFHTGRDIQKIENDAELFQAILDAVRSSDGMLWCFPVFYLCVPSPLNRFIELIFERGQKEAFHGKYSSAITTSGHFFDHVAHNYVQAVSEDLGMQYLKGFSAEMQDLLKPEIRENLDNFAERFFRTAVEKQPAERVFEPLKADIPEYKPEEIAPSVKSGKWKVVLVTDATEADVNLNRMTNSFIVSLSNPVEVINLHRIRMKGGCLSCYQCGIENVCVYDDDIGSIYREKLMKADAIVYAAGIRDRFFSSRMKMFWDRSFFLGHTPPLMGKQVSWIISGPLRQIPNLRQMIEGLMENCPMNLVGIVSDEYPDSGEITGLLENLGREILLAVENKTRRQPSFFGVGGHLLFRDLIYRGSYLFRADDRFYRKHGLYDYPQNNLGERLTSILLWNLTSIPAIRRKFFQGAFEKMLEPYKKLLKDVGPRQGC